MGENGVSEDESRFRHRTRSDDENIANFQGVPHTFAWRCSSEYGARFPLLCLELDQFFLSRLSQMEEYNDGAEQD